MSDIKILRDNWNNIDQLNQPKEKIQEIKKLKEKSIELETEFFNIFLKTMTQSFLGDKNKKNALMETGGDLLGREWGKQMGEFTQHQFAKDLFLQESNKIVGTLET